MRSRKKTLPRKASSPHDHPRLRETRHRGKLRNQTCQDLQRHLSLRGPNSATRVDDCDYKPFFRPLFRNASKKLTKQVNVEIGKRSDTAKGFVPLPRRWVVERTFTWFGECRRLAKDRECLNRKGRTLLRLASIRRMMRKLCNPA